MLVWVKTDRAGLRKMREEGLTPPLATDNISQNIRLLHVQNDHRGSTPDAVRERGPCLLVRRFAVYHHRVATRTQCGTALPDLLDEGTGGIVVVGVNTACGKRLLDLEGGTEGGYDDNVCRGEFVPWDQLSTGRDVEVAESGTTTVSAGVRLSHGTN